MKNCPNCGSPIDPYRVKCEYCGTMYFDWATWMQDGEPCYINYRFNNGIQKGTITTLAIPRLETVEISNEYTDIMDYSGNSIRSFRSSQTCELNVRFNCLNHGGRLFTLTEE